MLAPFDVATGVTMTFDGLVEGVPVIMTVDGSVEVPVRLGCSHDLLDLARARER